MTLSEMTQVLSLAKALAPLADHIMVGEVRTFGLLCLY